MPVINAQENGSAITVSVDDVRLENLTINGSVFSDAGVNVTLINCTIKRINGKSNLNELELINSNNIIRYRNNSTDRLQDIRLLSSYKSYLLENNTLENSLGIDLNNSRNNSSKWNKLISNLNDTELYLNDSNYLLRNKTRGYVSGIDPFRSKNYSIFGNNLSNHSDGIALNFSGNGLLSKNITYPIEYYSREGNNTYQNNYKQNIKYNFNYKLSANNSTIEAKDSVGWTNRSGARRYDWEYESLSSGGSLNINNNLLEGERILSAEGPEGEWLPCGGSGMPSTEKLDEGWPSSATEESVHKSDDEKENEHKKPAQYASNQAENSNGKGSKETSTLDEEGLSEADSTNRISQEEMLEDVAGKVVFNPPFIMFRGIGEDMEARIAANNTSELFRDLQGRGKPRIINADIVANTTYVVRLIEDHHFEVVDKRDEAQTLSNDPMKPLPFWIWFVNPKEEGNGKLILSVDAVGQDGVTVTNKTTWAVQVKVIEPTPWQKLINFIITEWKWILGPGAGILYGLYRGRRYLKNLRISL